MAPIRNARAIFNSVPTDYPEPGKTIVYDDSETIDLENVPLNGGLLIKILVLSIDPYLRVMLRAPEVKSYAPAFTIGEPLVSHGVGVVIRSELEDVKPGDHVYGLLSHEEYVVRGFEGLRTLKKEPNLPWSVYVGAAGMPGKTAYMGWKEFSHAKKGETVFVSAGAGSVGSLVVQLAKLDGLKVIASAGSEEKVKFLKELGVDVAFNYKTTKTAEVLEKEGPIDIYWDNVGGQTLDDALLASNLRGRFIECGMISDYNGRGEPIKNAVYIFAKHITLYGFVVGLLKPKYDAEFYATIPPKLASGELKYTEEVTTGLDKVGDVIIAVQKGYSKAKAVIKVADEQSSKK